MKLGGVVVVGICSLASAAHADGPSLAVRAAVGVRTSSNNSHGDSIADETSSIRLAAEGLVGVRLGPVVVGLHGGVATPFKLWSIWYFGSAEIVPSTESNIYPVDYGLGVELESSIKLWFSGWIGATTAFTHAHSPAVMANNIQYYGYVPEASWRYSTTSLGYGIAFGYDVIKNEDGRVAAMIAVESEGLGPTPVRDDYGTIRTKADSLSATSLTIGASYAY